MLNRRNLVAASLAAGAFSGRAFAAPGASTRLLVVFLRGAYDAASIVVPAYSDFYYQARPSIAIARPDAANPKAALPLDGQWALHPALAQSLYPLWQRKEIAFVPFAGADDMSRSHFETQEAMELGQPLGATRNYRSGFMARLAASLGDARPIAFSNDVPLIFRGGGATPNLSITDFGKPSFDERQQRLIDSMYSTPAAQALAPEVAIKQGFAVRAEAYAMQDEMTRSAQGAPPARGLQRQAPRIAGLMREHYNLAFLDVGGWDTHTRQGGADGQLADKIGDLGAGLAAFADAMGSEWRNTTVIVVSEFGRTFRENGDKGTDHGHGSVYWVLGGGVKGGRIAGPQVQIAAGTLNQDRDLPVLTDYRGLIGGVARRLYGLSPEKLDRVFPSAPPVELDLV
jgi:uncharacterized protein (DUF1501 family)